MVLCDSVCMHAFLYSFFHPLFFPKFGISILHLKIRNYMTKKKRKCTIQKWNTNLFITSQIKINVKTVLFVKWTTSFLNCFLCNCNSAVTSLGLSLRVAFCHASLTTVSVHLTRSHLQIVALSDTASMVPPSRVKEIWRMGV